MSELAGQVVIAENEDHVADVVAGCIRDRIRFDVSGGDAAAVEGRCVISTASLTAVIEHEVQDLTVTVQSGITAAALAAVVAGKGQRVILECARPDHRTIGGLYSGAVDGFRADALGSLRDQVLGLRAVLPDGSRVRAGGRVVKNVTGYDLGKLFWGARGALGVVTEMTLRLRARPRAERTIVSTHDDPGSCFVLAWELRDLPCRVTGIAVSRESGRWRLSARLEGREATLDAVCGPLLDVGFSRAVDPWSRLSDDTDRGARQVVVRTPVEGLAEAVRFVDERLPGEAVITADAARGILHVGCDGEGPSLTEELAFPSRPDWRVRVPGRPVGSADAGRALLLERIRRAFAPEETP